ncbi:hypothetical protein, partial [Xanthomonas fragariae]|uniref:hypothetical protein n=1 Tax=Xanthomonas fragariae TaxID=48664 RepID=UPI001F229789
LRNQLLDALPQRNGDLFATCHVRNFATGETRFKGVLLDALNPTGAAVDAKATPAAANAANVVNQPC